MRCSVRHENVDVQLERTLLQAILFNSWCIKRTKKRTSVKIPYYKLQIKIGIIK
jgi:hypothetical protein